MEQEQGQFDFDSKRDARGFNSWHQQRQAALKELAKQMGLPLGHRVEVLLIDGIQLTGMLRLKEDQLFVPEHRDFSLQLVVDGVPFTAAELESCLRLD